MSVKRLSLELCTSIKDNTDLVWLVGVVNTMVRYVPNTTIGEVKVIVRDSFSLSFGDHLLHQDFKMILILSVFLVPLFEPFEVSFH